MATYRVGDDEVSEQEALALDANVEFTIHYDDGKVANCYRISDDTWKVRKFWKDFIYERGAVDRVSVDGLPMYVARNVQGHSAQQHFSAAALKFLD